MRRRPRIALLLPLAAVTACGRAPSAPSGVPTGHAWPEADALFRQDPRWLGADGAYSVDLGAGRVLWLFGDTFVSPSAAEQRAHATMVRNTVAIQSGYDPSRASMSFYWATTSTGAPDAMFPGEKPDSWFWPGHGALVGGQLVVFLSRLAPSSGGLGFQANGWTAVRIDDPEDPPSSWVPTTLRTPPATFGVTFGEAAIAADGFLYACGAEDQTHAVYLVRWPAGAVGQGDLSQPDWRTPSGWVAQSALSALPAPLIMDGSTELSMQPAPIGAGWLEVQTVGFGAATLDLRSAPGMTGPWGSAVAIYTPPESNRPDVLVYAGKGHAELQGAQLVATYATGSTNFDLLVGDTSLGFPRFVRVTWPARDAAR
jgi:hypothetical protein